MESRFRNVCLLTLGVSVFLGACTIIQDPVTPMNPHPREPAGPPARTEPAPTAAPAPTPQPGTPAAPVTAAPPVVTPIAPPPPMKPVTPAEPAKPGIEPAKPPPRLLPIPRLPRRDLEPKKPHPTPERVPPEDRPRPPLTPATGLADGQQCSSSSQCTSGICEGMGCGWNQGKCMPVQRSCTRDLRLFCGCDRKEFKASSSCPGRVFLHPGACIPTR